MANNNWNNYTEKTATPVDADEVMVRDSTDGKNKKLLFGTFWKWVAKKLNEATISELQTSNKTIVGALNQLNSESSKTRFNGNISRMIFRSGSAGISNVYLDFWTTDGKRTTIGFYTDGTNGIQMMKDDTVIWTIKA
nr:hypothetical protein [uncultured Blautia sp.]